MPTYPVYRNDIKYKKHRDIDPNSAEWTDDIKNAFLKNNTDSIEYRIDECIKEKLETLDLSHMNNKCFDEFMAHTNFSIIKNKVQHIFAQSSNLTNIPNLNDFPNLITLDLSDNNLIQLNELPQCLEELILNNNNLTSLIYDLPNLKRLKISNNKITDIKLSNSIESAYLNNNPINSIPNMDNIKYLNISNTNITHICSYPRLEILECCYTKIDIIPKLDKLKELICNYSSVSDITQLNHLEFIEMINTNINKLHYIPSLCNITYNNDNKFRISQKYRLLKIIKNKNNIYEITFNISKTVT